MTWGVMNVDLGIKMQLSSNINHRFIKVVHGVIRRN